MQVLPCDRVGLLEHDPSYVKMCVYQVIYLLAPSINIEHQLYISGSTEGKYFRSKIIQENYTTRKIIQLTRNY